MSAPAIAAAALRAEREIVAHLRQHGAISPATAVALPELRLVGRRRLARLIDARVVRPAEGGGHYLDETLYGAYRADRRGALVAAVVAGIGLLAAVWLAQRAQGG